jgi:hypothetical protein
MRMWMRMLLGIAVGLSLISGGKALACNEGYCDWGGVYATGGYDLYSFAVDYYQVMDYSYSSNSCSTCSCNTCYESASLWDNVVYQQSSPWIDQAIQQVTQNIYSLMYGLNPTIPPTNYPPTGLPPTGYPPTGYPPTGFPPTGYPPTGYPPTTYPPTGFPPVTGYPPILPPPAKPPVMGCDNIFVMCPTGPVIPPVTGYPPVTPTWPTNPPGGGTPPNGPGPSYQKKTETVPTAPVRYRVPRGVTH